MIERIERHSTAWYEALNAFMAARATTPFSWQRHHCCSFAADWVQVVTGSDPMGDVRDMLSSPHSAQLKLRALGGMLAAVDARMGPHIAGPFAQAGDVAMVVQHGHPDIKSLAVCIGPWLAGPGPGGLLMLPIEHAEATWRV